MRIVNREKFLSMPEETLFSKYEPCFFGPLMIKGETLVNDFFVQQIADAVKNTESDDFADILLRAQDTGDSFDLDFDCIGRDGLFDDAQLFAVWEPADIAALISRLQSLTHNGAVEGSEPLRGEASTRT